VALSVKDWAENQKISVEYFENIDSTNLKAKNYELNLDPQILVADHQTAGQGREGRKWLDNPGGHSLLASFRIPLTKPPPPAFSLRVGLLLQKCSRNAWPELDFNLKLPNDLLIGKDKVAGLLIDNLIVGDECLSIIGLGMNIFGEPPLGNSIEKALVGAGHMKGPSIETWHQWLSKWWQGLQQLSQIENFPTELSPLESQRLSARS
jgi:biotin-[acetyl-CoA-carboxylase] ligase BirA-like protein